MKCAKRLDVVFCMMLLYVTTAESFRCLECKSGECNECKQLKTVECVAPPLALGPPPPPAGGAGNGAGGDEGSEKYTNLLKVALYLISIIII